MVQKTAKKLVIFDLDNTLTDTLTFWGRATAASLQVLADELKLDDATLRAAVLKAPAQYRFCDFGALVEWLDAEGHLPKAATTEEEYERHALKWCVRQMWFQKQKDMSVFYDGALETLRQIKADGGAIAIYSDTEASALIRRFWLMAYNAGGRDLEKAHEILNLVDHFYCMPSIEDDQGILGDVDVDFVHDLKARLTLWSDKIWKPAPGHTGTILKDFGASPQETLFVGDTDKDGGSARPIDVDFAWYKPGADTAPETIRTAQRLASPLYKYGLQAIIDAFTPLNEPTVTLDRSLEQLFNSYSFEPGRAFIPAPDCNAQTTHPYPHSCADQVCRNLGVVRLSHFFRSQARLPPLGPATHLPPAPAMQAGAGPCGTADPEKTAPPPVRPQESGPA
jgi:phosphoglycolate phosphatase-like HAD superfamily hydrolase